MENLDEMCVVNTHTMQLWKYLNPGEDATEYIENEMAEAKERVAKFEVWAEKKEKPEDRQYWSDQAAAEKAAKFEIMRFGDYLDMKKRRILEDPMEEITAETFMDALEALPPVQWTTINGVEVFCFREFLDGSFTSQYAHDHSTGKCWMKTVDVLDRSTWIPSILYSEREV